MENNIKIIRLLNGQDIIGKLYTDKENLLYIIDEPMGFSTKEFRGCMNLQMWHYLPVQLIKKNEVVLHSRNVLTIIEPDDEFVEYYSNTVEKINNLLKAREITENLSEEESNEIMQALDEIQSENRVIH